MRKGLSSKFCHLKSVIEEIISKFVDHNEIVTIQELAICVILLGVSTNVLHAKD